MRPQHGSQTRLPGSALNVHTTIMHARQGRGERAQNPTFIDHRHSITKHTHTQRHTESNLPRDVCISMKTARGTAI